MNEFHRSMPSPSCRTESERSSHHDGLLTRLYSLSFAPIDSSSSLNRLLITLATSISEFKFFNSLMHISRKAPGKPIVAASSSLIISFLETRPLNPDNTHKPTKYILPSWICSIGPRPCLDSEICVIARARRPKQRHIVESFKIVIHSASRRNCFGGLDLYVHHYKVGWRYQLLLTLAVSEVLQVSRNFENLRP